MGALEAGAVALRSVGASRAGVEQHVGALGALLEGARQALAEV